MLERADEVGKEQLVVFVSPGKIRNTIRNVKDESTFLQQLLRIYNVVLLLLLLL